MTVQPGEMTLHMTRVLGAPRSLVFRACTEPDQLARWWGPRGFTAPSVEIDLRVGGLYRIAMQPPAGEVFYLSGEFREVNPPFRLAYTFRWQPPDVDDVETVVTLVLRELGERTEVEITHGIFATEQRRALHEAGWTEALDRLQEWVSTAAPGGATLLMSKI
jgi:uncharacterized protein YndB with AHSA1/START domain